MRFEAGRPANRAEHLVQFYGDDEASLIANVTSFMRASLTEGGNGIVIATDSRLEALRRELSGHRNMLFIDARDALANFMFGGMPHPALFDATIGKAVRAWGANSKLHAYGEMVAVLWEAGMDDAAIALEGLWNDLVDAVPFSLYCAYPLAHPDERIVSAHSDCVALLTQP